MGDIEILIYDNYHLKYHSYCKYHDISKLVITVQQTLKLVGFITYVEKILVFLIHKSYNFYDIVDNITIYNDISVLKNSFIINYHGT